MQYGRTAVHSTVSCMEYSTKDDYVFSIHYWDLIGWLFVKNQYFHEQV